MKLSEITSAMIARAVEIYLRVAYPDETPPERVLTVASVDPAGPLQETLGRDAVQKLQVAGRPGAIDRYLWRLGNARYAHMKLGLGRCSGADDFVFLVDTHDRDVASDRAASHSPDYVELIQHNARLKQAIEAQWDQAGLPTMRGHLTSYLRQRCAVASRRPRTILIVDDDDDVLELEQALVEEAGYRVIAATDAIDALSRLHREGPVDLCLLDIMMPGLDGRNAARQLRRQSQARFPIVYVTALPRDAAADDFADDYVGKPFDADYLLAVIRRHLG